MDAQEILKNLDDFDTFNDESKLVSNALTEYAKLYYNRGERGLSEVCELVNKVLLLSVHTRLRLEELSAHLREGREP